LEAGDEPAEQRPGERPTATVTPLGSVSTP
jgi:hypothetical protein